MKLYCPKCGEPLTESDTGELECVPGKMPLAPALEKRLRQTFGPGGGTSVGQRFTYGGRAHAVGGRWYCPCCGVRAAEQSPGDLRCPRCGRSLVEFVVPLTELHPHT